MTKIQSAQKMQILELSSKLFMQKGIKSVSMDDLANALGMSKKTIYQYFENKTDIVEHMISLHIDKEKEEIMSIKQNAENAIDEMRQIGRMAVRTLTEVSSGTMFDLQKYYRTLWMEISGLHKKVVFETIKENILWGIKEEVYRRDINADVVAKLYVEQGFCVVDNDLFPQREFEKQALFRESFKYHIYGILSPKGYKLFQKLNKTAE